MQPQGAPSLPLAKVLASQARDLCATINNMSEELAHREKELAQRETAFAEINRELAKRFPLNDLIELNVSGKHFTTTKAILCKVITTIVSLLLVQCIHKMSSV
jgi:hypothetical protein